MSGHKRVYVVQYGLGQVGQALLRQVLAGRERLAARTGLELRHVALLDSRGTLMEAGGLDDRALQRALAAKGEGIGLDRQAGGTIRLGRPLALPGANGPVAVVDVTAADGMEAVALDALERGWGVVLANKRPLAGPLETFRRLAGSHRLRHEATVGAGLPWIKTLTHLLDTGDRVLRLEAAVSGTLGFVAWRMEQGASFSAAVREARSLGYTEPDPRDDLGAADVRRKGLILARMLGHSLNWEDLPAEPLYPAAWDALDVEGFLARLAELDAAIAERTARARAAGQTLRYTVEIEGSRCAAGLHQVASHAPLGALQGPNCLLAFHTERYRAQPLVISGPGAGAEVTAAGVHADIIALGLEL